MLTPLPGNAAFPVPNAMSVDVEDYFHAAALGAAAPRDRWDTMESRVEASTNRTLALFDEAGVKATFFTLGCVAEQFPGLVRSISDAGHEIASHGYRHHRVGEQSKPEFAKDVKDTKSLLEDICGKAVIGYRAPNFSIGGETWWAYEQLSQAGYRYSSSVNPVPHDHYGVPSAPRLPFRPGVEGIVELPLTSLLVAGRRFHASGGGYFRLMPYALYSLMLRHIIRTESQPAHFYFHPWEIDPGQPRLSVKARSRFRHYVNLSAMEAKLRRLLADFSWARVDEVYAREINTDTANRVCIEWNAA
ncbi:polysaccharide deacetylase family protein (PEP-CTERM system associated) [Pararhizobium capsulatum DSM 1112]|uniref:Chitooligosaccharide deacetylase n=1 Tax=Pararhizobium capsulatum DSM 1112 TaxID=1121113 RepID=A0ABU0BS62_9HYPH|nr:XrtA system polysaccharide deacetylase [Pararhizobium capsulatum]MDQ0321101.1 polysaccharide deacetylase family protein (PEP-CTERM system associated) [Pararhizobium capsulatum DSM 1112]